MHGGKLAHDLHEQHPDIHQPEDQRREHAGYQPVQAATSLASSVAPARTKQPQLTTAGKTPPRYRIRSIELAG